MAFGMRHWLGLVLAGCAYVAIQELPPEAHAMSNGSRVTFAEQRAAELSRQVRRTHEVLKRMRWADSLPALLEATAVDGIGVGAPAAFPDSSLAAIRTQLAFEIAAMDRTDPDMLVGYYVQLSDQSAQPGVPSARLQGSPEVLTGTVGGRPYCIDVVLLDRAQMANQEGLKRFFPFEVQSPKTTNLLGYCGVRIRFGPPGRAVSAWLRRGGYWFTAPDQGVHIGLELRRRTTAARESMLVWQYTGSPSSSFRGCLARRAEACEHAFLLPREGYGFGVSDEDIATNRYVTAHTRFLVPTYSLSYTPPFGPSGPYIFADLEHQFGADAVARFWTSDQDVPTAFQQAFGVDLESWLVAWTNQNLFTYRPGPSLARSDLLGVMVFLALCGAVAAARTRRRSVA